MYASARILLIFPGARAICLRKGITSMRNDCLRREGVFSCWQKDRPATLHRRICVFVFCSFESSRKSWASGVTKNNYTPSPAPDIKWFDLVLFRVLQCGCLSALDFLKVVDTWSNCSSGAARSTSSFKYKSTYWYIYIEKKQADGFWCALLFMLHLRGETCTAAAVKAVVIPEVDLFLYSTDYARCQFSRLLNPAV